MSDFGTGTMNGIVITMQKAAATSDYAVLAQSSNGDTVTVPTINYVNPAVGDNNYAATPGEAQYGQSNAAAQQWLVDDASMYQAKSTKQFRLCYPDVMSPWNVEPYKSGTALNAEPFSNNTIRKSVNTLFFAVIQ
jgi:predicted lipid-binding transport protein (Tim44 family)